MDKIKTCPKCDGEMRPGDYTGTKVGWEKEGHQSFLKDSGQAIVTYACSQCGYLESYVIWK